MMYCFGNDKVRQAIFVHQLQVSVPAVITLRRQGHSHHVENHIVFSQTFAVTFVVQLLIRQFMNKPSDNNRNKYVSIRNHCSKVYRNAQRRYIHSFVENRDLAKVWNF